MAGDGSPAGRRSPAVLYGRSVFVITFSKKNNPHDLKIVTKDATHDSIQSALKIRLYTKNWINYDNSLDIRFLDIRF
jgi:hypothetical protein